MSEPLWELQWKEQGHLLLHRGCWGSVYFNCPDSEGTPTVAHCPRCEAVWRKDYDWQQERGTGLHMPGQPDPPNLMPRAGWTVEIHNTTDVPDVPEAGTVASADCHIAGPPFQVDESGRLVVCWEVAERIHVDLPFDARIRPLDPRDQCLQVVLEPTPEFLAITDRREARRALSMHLGDLGDLAWAAWQKAHPEGGDSE